MATKTTTPGSVEAPADVLRGVADTDVTVTTFEGQVTGSVLSCTRLSVWLISDDEDHVISLDDITAVVVHG